MKVRLKKLIYSPLIKCCQYFAIEILTNFASSKENIPYSVHFVLNEFEDFIDKNNWSVFKQSILKIL